MKPDPRPSVTAVLACHNRKTKTLACLASLQAQDIAIDLQVVLFDDGSTDGTAEAVRRLCPGVHVMRGDGTAYWAGGMRAAFAKACQGDDDYSLWLNDDVVLAPQAVRTLIETHEALMRQGHRLCLIGGAVADARDGRTSYAGIARPHADRPLRFRMRSPDETRPQRCDTLVGNIVLVPRATSERVGPMGADYRHTLADLDYGLRVAATGGWVGLAPGHLGWCERDTASGRWFDPALPLRERWKLVRHPLGFPLKPWIHFARRHGGPFWWLFAPLPYWRLFVPVRFARVIDAARRRDAVRSDALRHA